MRDAAPANSQCKKNDRNNPVGTNAGDRQPRTPMRSNPYAG